MRICKYCQTRRPEQAFEVCRVVSGKVYRRLRCQECKRTRRQERRTRLRLWLDDLKKTLRCERCGFSDYRALVFHHRGGEAKNFNIGDMLGPGYARRRIEREIGKCMVLCSNCHQIEHYDERK